MVGQHPHRRPDDSAALNDPEYEHGSKRPDEGRLDEDGAGLPVVFRDGSWDAYDDRHPIIDRWPVAIPPEPPEDLRPVARRRFSIYAAGILIAATLGGVIGALAVAGFGQVADGGADTDETVIALRTSIGQLATEIRSLKTGIGADSEVTAEGLAAIEQRMAGAEQAQTALSAKIADLSAAAANTTTLPVGVSGEITGSLGSLAMPVVNDWILWRVRNGRALVQNGGGYFEIVPGSSLPGLGIVDRITRENGRWVVFTERGVILDRG